MSAYRFILDGNAFESWTATWHLIPDLIFDDWDLQWLIFRQAYTAIPWMLYAMTRLWTGTILYAVIIHTAVNFIALELRQ